MKFIELFAGIGGFRYGLEMCGELRQEQNEQGPELESVRSNRNISLPIGSSGDDMKIARVFPTKTKFSPTDPDAYFGLPAWFLPKYDRIEISVTFTWDIPKVKQLTKEWSKFGPVFVGGPAYGDPGGEFTPGKYIKKGVTFTSRGCPNKCGFCLVSKREGCLRELPVKEGNIIQDNNFLACSKEHKRKVYDMLKDQKGIEFKGGLDKFLLTDWDIKQLKDLRIKELWFACDSPGHLNPLRKVVKRLHKAGFSKHKIRCYVLCGKDMKEEGKRLREILKLGVYPFAQLYRNEKDDIKYSKRWEHFARTWSRPALFKKLIKEEKNKRLTKRLL